MAENDGGDFDPAAIGRELQAIRERLRRLGGEGEAVLKKLDATITEAEQRFGRRREDEPAAE